MTSSTLLNFRTVGFDNKREAAQRTEALSLSDVRRFVDAATPADFDELLSDYSSATLPLFGRCEIAWDSCQAFEDCKGRGDPTTVADCRNMATLLISGLLLCHFADSLNVEYDDLENAGLIIHETGGQDDQVSMGIGLEITPETVCFLNHRLAVMPPDADVLTITSYDDTLVIWLTGDVLGACNNDPNLMCEALLNRLSDLMLLDISIRFQRRSAIAISHTPASSLWLTMLFESLDGRVGVCEVCGKPYVAKRERGQKRRTCSDRCRKALSSRRLHASSSKRARVSCDCSD